MICAACAYSACIVIYESELRSVNNKNKKIFLDFFSISFKSTWALIKELFSTISRNPGIVALHHVSVLSTV